MASSKEVSTMIKQGFISDPSISLSLINKPTTSKTSPSKPISFSPPPSFSRSTLFEMMSEEQLRESKQSTHNNLNKLHDKLGRVLCKNPNFVDSNNSSTHNLGGFGFCFGFNDGDVKLTVSGRDGFKVSIDVNRDFSEDVHRHDQISLPGSNFFL